MHATSYETNGTTKSRRYFPTCIPITNKRGLLAFKE
jgi:hypothetical protein